MKLKIFHTGDIHIGMKFNNYPENIRQNLSEARFITLENMINLSNDRNSDIFVVAGDLFNTVQIAKKHIIRTVKILNKFNGACVLVLPGNHDYSNGMIDLWETFIKESNEKILLLNENKYYNLKKYDLDVIIYPAHCHSKHSNENNLNWIKEKGVSQDGKHHIGIAHGALEGLSADIEGNYYPMEINELNSIPMDLWLLGHAHVMYPDEDNISNNKIFNAGTPEPDGLDYRYEGAAWYITMDKQSNIAEKIITGKYRFIDQEFEINSDEDIDNIKTWALSDEPDKKIIRLFLKGSISDNAYQNLSYFYTDLESKLFHLMIDDSDLKIKIDEAMIEKEFTKGSFPYEFLKGLLHDKEALQIAYDLLRRE